MTVGTKDEASRLRRGIRAYLLVFIVGLVLSGVTAFPLTPEVSLLARITDASGLAGASPTLATWLGTVQVALSDTEVRHPFLFYGTDWLAFGHIIIALFFVGPLLDPVRNVFVLRAGVVACALVLPLAFVCGPIRGIPFWWQLIDCSFGVLGAIPLLLCIKSVRRLEAIA